MENLLNELHSLKRMKEELEAEIEGLQDKIKEEMRAKGVDTLTAGDWKVTWKAYDRASVDTKKLRQEMPEIADKYTKISSVKRFTIN